MGLRSLWREFTGWRAYQALPLVDREVVVYAEDGGSWTHLGPVVERLIADHGVRVAYWTSSPTDPLLAAPLAGMRAFNIGEGTIRTLAFSWLDARMLVMTMPDLQTFHIKRSSSANVHYAYIFHSMVSTQMTYREHAFDAFDSVLCVGPHHVEELRAAEALRGLPAKELVEHGYGRLDQLLDEAASRGDRTQQADDPWHVLLAPTWGPTGLLEAHGQYAIDALRGQGYRVTVRPHPMTARRNPEIIAAIAARAEADPLLALDLDMNNRASLWSSHAMVSDWSGAALEYAFGLERPVIFIDLPRKVNNPAWSQIGEPLEARLRDELGVLVPSDDGPALVAAVERLRHDPLAVQARLRALRAAHVFNVGASGAAGAAWLAQRVAALRANPAV